MIPLAEILHNRIQEDRDLGQIYTKNVDLAFNHILNCEIDRLAYIDIPHKVIDFKDGSVLVFKVKFTGYYTQWQDKRG
jgi:hypothetical protein